jgi:hypothetical protein
MKSLYCLRCKLGWTEWGRWPKSCPFCGSKRDVIPSEEAR